MALQYIHCVYVMIVLLSARPMMTSAQPAPVRLSGKTMGTTYSVVYFDKLKRDFQVPVDSLLMQINKAISTYDPQSEVSKFNTSKSGISFNSFPYFKEALLKAKEVHSQSGGAFDVTVMPLVDAWGFGPGTPGSTDQKQLDSIREFVGFDKILISAQGVSKTDRRVRLDFGGIGQGYAVDVITAFLVGKGITDFLIELGGEGFGHGQNLQFNRAWQIAITDPGSTVDEQFARFYLRISNRAFTTSGNYFNKRSKGGRSYGHTINPFTGNPEQNDLLSASVFADDCATADAWATAFMVLGFDRSIKKLRELKNIDAIFVYKDAGGETKHYISPGLESSIITGDQ